MPTVAVKEKELHQELGRAYTQAEFEDLCFEFGIELDDVTSEAEMAEKMTGGSGGADAGLSTDVIYKIDVPANRYDLLCIEGIARALRIFLGAQEAPVYRCVEPASGARLRMTVEAPTASVRPFVVCAVLRGVTFTEQNYASFIDLQDKLHQNICRRRTLVAIGTHDLATLQPPFRYRALPPRDISFVPLTEGEGGRAFDAASQLEHYATDGACRHLAPYVPIIRDEPLYPVIYDAAGVVLSLPPIINSRHSRIQMHTRDVFIECTATDATKANIVLDTVVAMFSEHCAAPFTAEPVDVVYEADGRVETTPKLSLREESAAVADVNSICGIDISAERMCELCAKMQLGPARASEDGARITVTVPPTRQDIMHAVDVAEDVGVAFGFNNIAKTLPKTPTVGAPQPLNHFCDLLRAEVARAGYAEMLTHGLCSLAENYTKLRREVDMAECVTLSNPANAEFEIVRTSLLPGALKTLHANRGAALSVPTKLFEVSDVVIRDAEDGAPLVSGAHDLGAVGARNCRRLVALYASVQGTGFEVLHALLTRVMQVVQVPHRLQGGAPGGKSVVPPDGVALAPRAGVEYYVRAGDDPAFFPGRCAEVVLVRAGDESVVGHFGVVHPEVLHNYGLVKNHCIPTSVLEMDLEPLQY